jgi:hypothetical protein
VQATVSVTVPPRTQSVGRAPRYVSPSTQSMVASVAPQAGGTTTTAMANCVLQQNGNNTCSTTIDAPVGPDTFTVNLYDAQNGTGNLLSSGTTNFTIVKNQTNFVALIFGGIPAAVKMSASPAFFVRGLNDTIQLTVTEVDADNNVIVGPPAAYPSPITLQISDTTGSVTLSRPQVASASEPPVTLTYNGSAAAPATVTVMATAPGIPAAKIDNAAIPIKTGTLIDVFDGGSFVSRTQQFFAQNGIVQVSTRQTAGEPYSLSAAIAPDGTVYIDAINSTARVVDVKSRDLTFQRSIAPDTSNGYLATDGGGNVYVSRTNGLKVYPPNSTSVAPPLRVITNVPQSPIAVDKHGNLIALSHSSVNVYPPNSTGIATAARTITPASGTAFGDAVSVDSSDNIYVVGTLFTQPAVFVYPPSANGAAPPSRYISGPHAFSGSVVIAVDAAGYLYACCAGGLQAFGTNASGDAAPISTFPVQIMTVHSGPWSIAVDPNAVTNAGPP